jgi:hypothetical protein
LVETLPPPVDCEVFRAPHRVVGQVPAPSIHMDENRVIRVDYDVGYEYLCEATYV